MTRVGAYVLDAGGVLTFIAGVVSVNGILMVLGGIASVAAAVNHIDQIIKRNRKR